MDWHEGQDWNEVFKEASQIGSQVEAALTHTTDSGTLSQLFEEFHHKIEDARAILLNAGEEGAVAFRSLEQRLAILRRRINIINMSQANTEGGYTKKRDENADYFTRNTDKIQQYIKIASHSIHSIDKQRNLLARSRQKLEDGLLYLGLSDRVVDQISNRHLTDYRLIQALAGLFILAFIYFFFARR
ncbi:hypothetical protein NEHOM01_1800 [Nematocida homosporus]|uniref:uncharacterized protein n=1 Tax=Nematocida homosporus TaxID=1912981 RepID=UPI00221FA8CA|nr:uncharacterized protein NEHOM01_1800 [Nematocida homosporus]KAI5186916.1 hypothetical protein NEHOM01_1800 [Nematocida homosporus]